MTFLIKIKIKNPRRKKEYRFMIYTYIYIYINNQSGEKIQLNSKLESNFASCILSNFKKKNCVK